MFQSTESLARSSYDLGSIISRGTRGHDAPKKKCTWLRFCSPILDTSRTNPIAAAERNMETSDHFELKLFLSGIFKAMSAVVLKANRCVYFSPPIERNVPKQKRLRSHDQGTLKRKNLFSFDDVQDIFRIKKIFLNPKKNM